MRVSCLRDYLSRTFSVNWETEDEFSKDSDNRKLIYT